MLIASDQLGVGDEALGQLLIAAFINTLPEAKTRPMKMLFINRGVLLTTEGSRVLDSLQKLESNGVQIFSCGTCLNHYQLKEKLKVGKVTNMYDTVDSLLNADNVIRI
jgi:selenium metabolism protein YedF